MTKIRIIDSDYSCRNKLVGRVFDATTNMVGAEVTTRALNEQGCYMNCVSDLDQTWFFPQEDYEIVDEEMEDHTEEYTGGSSSYYMLYIKHPTTLEDPYHAECNDIIETLNMTPAEANVFKGVWRKAAARTLGVKKKGYDSGVYDSEKCVFFSERMLVRARLDNEGG